MTDSKRREVHAAHGDVVFSLAHSFRTAIVWIMMPAALWSGMQAPECECASGEHRFFCGNLFTAFRSEPTTTARSMPSCCATHVATATASLAADSSPDGMSGVSSSAVTGPCNSCRAIPSSPLKIGDRSETPSQNRTDRLLSSMHADQISLALVLGSEYGLPSSDLLPMTDRVIVFRRLLI